RMPSKEGKDGKPRVTLPPHTIGYSLFDVSVVIIASIATTVAVLTSSYADVFLPGFRPGWSKYNNSQLTTPETHSDGSATHSLFLITDLDHDSKSADKKNTWFSLGLKASLSIGKGAEWAKLSLGEEKAISSQISAGGRAMELSDLVVFDGRLLSCDDRTGLLYEICPATNKAFPWVFLPDGPGKRAAKGLKAEWMTVKAGELVVGGLGKEWTTTTGEYVNDDPMWVKFVSPEGGVRHVNWRDVYVLARRAIGVEYPGYTINEAVQWSEVHKRWFFLPRRASKEKYDETEDESRGTNKLISCNEKYEDWQVVEIGDAGNGARGFSAFQFVPGSHDEVIVGLKSEEKDGKPVASYLSVFTRKGKIVLADSELNGPHKYEGIAFA
ncbi:hypothetical protein PFISCL1PPCAC_24000, partial [Pristionchus fissidentatus]